MFATESDGEFDSSELTGSALDDSEDGSFTLTPMVRPIRSSEDEPTGILRNSSNVSIPNLQLRGLVRRPSEDSHSNSSYKRSSGSSVRFEDDMSVTVGYNVIKGISTPRGSGLSVALEDRTLLEAMNSDTPRSGTDEDDDKPRASIADDDADEVEQLVQERRNAFAGRREARKHARRRANRRPLSLDDADTVQYEAAVRKSDSSSSFVSGIRLEHMLEIYKATKSPTLSSDHSSHKALSSHPRHVDDDSDHLKPPKPRGRHRHRRSRSSEYLLKTLKVPVGSIDADHSFCRLALRNLTEYRKILKAEFDDLHTRHADLTKKYEAIVQDNRLLSENASGDGDLFNLLQKEKQRSKTLEEKNVRLEKQLAAARSQLLRLSVVVTESFGDAGKAIPQLH